MAADQTATLGPVLPPARGTQGGAPTTRRGGTTRDPRGLGVTIDTTGAPFRQITRWGELGLLGRRHQAVGSGRHRRFDDDDLEVITSLASLSALGATEQWLRVAADLVRAERVQPGEWLLVTIAGHGLRCAPGDLPRIIHHTDGPHAAWLIPLQAFDQGRPL